MKTWLITTSAPFCGTEQYYMAYSEISPDQIQEVNDWFWNEETIDLWDIYSYLCHYDEEYDDDENEETYDEYIESRIQEWQEDCNMECSEMSLEELEEYGYNGELPECIYDERNISNNN